MTIQLSSGKFGDQHINSKTKEHQKYLIRALEQKPGIQYEGCDGKIHTLKQVLVEYGVFHKRARNSSAWSVKISKPTDPNINWFVFDVIFISTENKTCYSSGHCFQLLKTNKGSTHV